MIVFYLEIITVVHVSLCTLNCCAIEKLWIIKTEK